jgi:hypothetical protein
MSDELIITPKRLTVTQEEATLELILSEHGLCVFTGSDKQAIQVALDTSTTRKIARALQEEYL